MSDGTVFLSTRKVEEGKTYYFKIQIHAFNYCKLQYIDERMEE